MMASSIAPASSRAIILIANADVTDKVRDSYRLFFAKYYRVHRIIHTTCYLCTAGVFCGSCRDGKGFSALLSRCVDCTNASSLLIVALGA